LAGDLLQRPDGDRRRLPAVRPGLHHRRRVRRPGVVVADLDRPDLHAGLHRPPHGLRLGVRRAAGAGPRRGHGHHVPCRQAARVLRRGGPMSVKTADGRVVVRNRRPTSERAKSALWHVSMLAVLAIVLYPLLWVVTASLKGNTDIITDTSLWPE